MWCVEGLGGRVETREAGSAVATGLVALYTGSEGKLSLPAAKHGVLAALAAFAGSLLCS